jgi:penicillin-binding protein 1C
MKNPFSTKQANRPKSPTLISQVLSGNTIGARRRDAVGKWGSRFKKFWWILFFPLRNKFMRYSLLALFILFVISIIILIKDLPSPRRLTNTENYPVSTQIFDRNGTLLYEIYADENRTPISLSDLPPYVYQASIAIEDKNFYRHFGFDIVGILRAVRSNITGGRLEGGSTITQQLVKNALLTRERSLQRKVKEGLLSIFTEIMYTKEDILEMYLNYIPYGGTSVGIESASKSYFDKHAKDLTLAEAALLAGLPQAPSRYSPFGSNPEQAKARQLDVLRRMEEDGYITALQREQAASDVLHFALSRTDIQAPHFVFYVRDLLYQEYGEEMVEKGGLRVTTTLDLGLQNTAQASVSAEVAALEYANVSNGAAVIIKPDTGEILSMIGSRDYFDAENDGQVNVTIRPRQPGSSIKPLVYATAFQEKLLNPGTMLIDSATCFEIKGQKPYCPKNYDGSFHGAVTIRQSLGNSFNIPAVKALKIVGLETFINTAKKLGITGWDDPSNYGLSISLGGGEVRMLDLAQAFSTLANQGVRVPVTPILKIENYQGETLFETNIEERKSDLKYLTEYEDTGAGELERVMDRAPAYLISHIMQDNNARSGAFGTRSELVIPNQVVSVKTGTTNDLKDNWTIGFTPEFLVATWVGNNDSTPMNGRIVSGVTGAAPIFNDIMRFVLQGKEPRWQEKPPDVASAPVCPTGFPKEASDNKCTAGNTELYWQKGKPSESGYVKTNVWIDPRTGLPPKFGEQVEGLVLEERTILQDPTTKTYCLDCNRPVNEEGKVQYEQNTIPNDVSNSDFEGFKNFEDY